MLNLINIIYKYELSMHIFIEIIINFDVLTFYFI